MAEEFAAGDMLLDGILQSPHSPVQSSYGGSDAGDNEDEVRDAEMDTSNVMEDQDETEEERDDDETQADETEASTTAPAPANNENTTSSGSPGQAASQGTTDPGKPRFKFKYPEAYPTPPGWDDETWNKAYTAADSRIYNHAKKNHSHSKLKRGEGVTRIEALEWEKNRPAREAKKASKRNTTTPKQQTSKAAASSSTPTSTSIDNDMARTKQVKRKKASPPVGNTSTKPSKSFTAPSPEDLSSFTTLADRIKGKSAASAAASSYAFGNESTPSRAESEKPSQQKKGGGGLAKRPAYPKDVHPPFVKAAVTPKVGASKARGSKSGTPASAPHISQYSEIDLFSDHEGEDDDNTAYCICRNPLSTNMIACDHCEEWFHRRPSCLGDDPAIYRIHEHSIDKWYCPPCKNRNPALQTTWYRMCRREQCNKPAQVDADPPNKYCSEKCAVDFFTEIFSKAPASTEPSMGGALNRSEIGKMLGSVSSAAEFKELGKAAPKLRAKGKVVSKQFLRNLVIGSNGTNGTNGESAGKVFDSKADFKAKTAEEDLDNRFSAPNKDLFNQPPDAIPLTREEFVEGTAKALGGGGDVTPDNYLAVDFGFLQRHGMIDSSESETIHDLQALMTYDKHWIKTAEFKIGYIKAIKEYSSKILKGKGMEPKYICGYLPFISMSDLEFRDWADTEEGARICQTAKYEPLDASQNEEWRKESEKVICTHTVKKHPQHYLWFETHEKENLRRRVQLTEDMHVQLKKLNELLSMVHHRLVDGNWQAVL